MDPVEQFCESFLKNMPVIGAVPFAGSVSKVEDVTRLLLYRHKQFQVEMFIAPEGTIIPEHTHPNVDSMQVYVGGNIIFTRNGKYEYPEEQLYALNGPLKCASKRGRTMRVGPNDKHGAVVGEGGGVFLAVQHWLNGIAPHSVAGDYDGMAMGEDHSASVVYGEVTVKKQLTPRDAAPLQFVTEV